MDTKNNFAHREGYQKAILRAYGDEPLVRYVALRTDGTIMVRNERSYRKWLDGIGPTDWIGWPQRDVYPFDQAIFDRLLRLYQHGKKDDLQASWASLSQLHSPAPAA